MSRLWTPTAHCHRASSLAPRDPLISLDGVLHKATEHPLSRTLCCTPQGPQEVHSTVRRQGRGPGRVCAQGSLQGSPGISAILVLAGKRKLSMPTCPATRKECHYSA